jgi:hypothetical protein
VKRLLFQLRLWWERRRLYKCQFCHGTGNVVYDYIQSPLYVEVCGCCDGDGWHLPL